MARKTARQGGRLARSRKEQPKAGRQDDRSWRTAITRIEPNTIEIRGYPVDELMGRISFAETIYLILRGELPTPSIGRLFAAVLVSSIDHGVTPPSTIAARNVATAGAPLRASVAAGVLGFGAYHGGDIESCMRFVDDALASVRRGASFREAAEQAVDACVSAGRPVPGFGHRIHRADPRASRLLQMAHELELDGEHVRMMRTLERVVAARPVSAAGPVPLNVDGAIAAVCADMGFEPELGNAMFIMARIPGLIAHANEERAREAPMRAIDSKQAVYDGPRTRRLPETWK
ncbi:MAG: Citrate synthase [Acidobacteria bacterium]|nr:Citrate synthase [Acidobacteriota bacterium]